jgi:hypothetical protein
MKTKAGPQIHTILGINRGRLGFFLFTTLVGMIIVMVMFLLFITGLQEKINGTQTVSLNVQT